MLKIKRLNENAILPTRATEGSAGYDVYAIEDVDIVKGAGIVSIKTGISIEVDDYGSFAIYLMIRSGLAKKGLMLANGVGLIDKDYRGEVIAMLCNISGDDIYTIYKGERIGQLVISPVSLPDVVEVDELSDTERGIGGFGSTGL